MRDREAQDCPGPGGDTVRPHGPGKTPAKIAGRGGETEAASPTLGPEEAAVSLTWLQKTSG